MRRLLSLLVGLSLCLHFVLSHAPSAAGADPKLDQYIATSSETPPAPVPANNPNVHGSLTSDQVHLNAWPANSVVTVSLSGGISVNTAVGSDGRAVINRTAHGQDLVPGMTLIASGPGGNPSKTLVLAAITFDSLDPASNVARGTAPGGAQVDVNVHDHTGTLGRLQTVTTSAGSWMIDFTGVVDVTYGMGGSASVNDSDGDGTNTNIFLHNPFVHASITGDWVNLNDWPANSSVTLTFNGTNQYNATVGPDGRLFIQRSAHGQDLAISTTIVVSGPGGNPSKTLVLAAVTFDSLDAATNIARGTAPAGSLVRVNLNRPGQFIGYRETTADVAGSWSVDLTSLSDVTYGMGASAYVNDNDNDATVADIFLPLPFIRASLTGDSIILGRWPAGRDVIVSINDIEACRISADQNGSGFAANCGAVDLVAGTKVVASEPITGAVKILILHAITFDTLDAATDVASGTVSPGSRPQSVQVLDRDGVLRGSVVPTVTEAGFWSASFAGIVNVEYGHSAFATISDPDGDVTSVGRRVLDTTPPTITVPASITADATGPGGATVSYEVSFTDNSGTVVTSGCTPASGGIFPIGDSTVTCTAADAAGNTVTRAFSVHVNSPGEQVTQLGSVIDGSTVLSQARQDSLLASLSAAQASMRSGNLTAACGQLTAFINKVKSQTGKGIPAALASDLIAYAERIKTAAGCL